MLPAIPTPIPMPFAQNGERRAIPETNTVPGAADASWATGFPPVTRINKQAGGKPPYGLDFQGIFHTICEHLFFSQSGNTVPWVGASDGQPGLNYFKGAVVQGSDGGTYMALKPSGPDTPNPDGGGMVGPVDPVGDESGHWINLNLLYGGMPNSELWITESGEFTVPLTGWYMLFVIDGGSAGGFPDTSNSLFVANGGAGGARKWHFAYLTEGSSIPVTIGAGGIITGLSSSVLPGKSAFGELTTEGEPAIPGEFSGRFNTSVGVSFLGATGGGPGGGANSVDGIPGTTGFHYMAAMDGTRPGAGGGAYCGSNRQKAAGNGAPGAVLLLWHDLAKANGPLPEPALFSARRMASRAADTPATVNLYDPETGQGSVWKEEDAEAVMQERALISQEAWQEICAQKAAEEREEWLADPDTEAERFELLRAARDVKLAATDYLVAPDYPLTEEQRAAVTLYRQALRDLPAQEGAPWDGGGEATPWPEEPGMSSEEA